jgi:hypothetical protein
MVKPHTAFVKTQAPFDVGNSEDETKQSRFETDNIR